MTKRGGARKAPARGRRLRCDVCGLIIIDQDCVCETCDLICCGRPMTPLR